MSKFNYHFTKSRDSGERLALIKIDQILTLLTNILQKLDSDTGVSDTNYVTLIANIKKVQEKIGCTVEELAEQE